MEETYASDSALVVSRGASYLAIQTVIASLAQVLAFAVLARIMTSAKVGVSTMVFMVD
jgi:O-antigen/teichoic acid export membrane protein